MILPEEMHKITPHNRYIVAKSGERTITFPDVLVSEIMIIERTSILPLPFYKPAIIGVIHHQANIIPLLLLQLILGEQKALLTESLTLIRLSGVVNDLNTQLGDKHLAGIGVVIDRVVGSLTIAEYQEIQSNRFDQSHGKNESTNNSDVSHDLPNNLSKKVNQTVANIGESEYTPIEIVLSTMLTDVWQPQRWQTSK
ncbi:MAG: hypothetical protein AUK48_15225 [Oscillatoriales cyanobacterium CG2_30_44_21]|nr:MAG: hypothetical protein AUK48_15225 [Oscillatoriales cyanobacterium CG2_30_44_21]